MLGPVTLHLASYLLTDKHELLLKSMLTLLRTTDIWVYSQHASADVVIVDIDSSEGQQLSAQLLSQSQVVVHYTQMPCVDNGILCLPKPLRSAQLLQALNKAAERVRAKALLAQAQLSSNMAAIQPTEPSLAVHTDDPHSSNAPPPELLPELDANHSESSSSPEVTTKVAVSLTDAESGFDIDHGGPLPEADFVEPVSGYELVLKPLECATSLQWLQSLGGSQMWRLQSTTAWLASDGQVVVSDDLTQALSSLLWSAATDLQVRELKPNERLDCESRDLKTALWENLLLHSQGRWLSGLNSTLYFRLCRWPDSRVLAHSSIHNSMAAALRQPHNFVRLCAALGCHTYEATAYLNACYALGYLEIIPEQQVQALLMPPPSKPKPVGLLERLRRRLGLA